MENNKVLITLGCSFTEGVGCYDYTGYSDDALRKIKEQGGFSDKLYGKNLNNFLEGSWGSQLQEILGVSTFYNVGKGGDSNSGQSKSFYDQIDTLNLKDKDVLVIFMMTYSHRFSFYNEGIPQTFDFTPNEYGGYRNKLVNEYVKVIIDDFDYNTVCEHFYYLRNVYELCKARGFKFAWCNVENRVVDEIYPMLPNDLKKCLLKHPIYQYDMIESILNSENPSFLSKICGHPNEHGYKLVAERIFGAITNIYPEFLRDKLVELYNNDTIQYEKIPINREEYKLKKKIK